MIKYLMHPKWRLVATLLVSLMAVCGYVGWSFLMQTIIDVATGKQAGSLVTVAAWLASYMVVMDFMGGLDQYLRPKLRQQAVALARTDLMKHALALSPAAFGELGVGTMVGKLTKQLDNVEHDYFNQILWLFYIGSQMVVATIATLTISPLVTLLIIGLCVPALVFPFLLKRLLARVADEKIAAIDAYTAKVTDLLSGFDTLKFALAGPNALRQHRQVNQQLLGAQLRNAKINAISYGISTGLNDLTYMAAWFLGAVMVQRGQMDMGQMVVFSTLTGYLTFPMMSLTQDIPVLIGGRRAAQKLAVFLAEPVPATGGQPLPPTAQPTLQLVSAGYRVDQRQLLAAVDLSLAPQEKVLMVGASGSGKTTLVRLLLGEITPTRGQATIGGVSATMLTRAAVYGNVGVLAQTGYVFTGTVAENLSLFGDQLREDQMKAAMQRAGLGEWLAHHALTSKVSASGPELSGGERQRLALARLFTCNYPYYVFDELTTGLDPHVAAELQRDLLKMPQGFLMITHTYNHAVFSAVDRILVVDHGALVASGPFSDLGVQAALERLELVAA